MFNIVSNYINKNKDTSEYDNVNFITETLEEVNEMQENKLIFEEDKKLDLSNTVRMKNRIVRLSNLDKRS